MLIPEAVELVLHAAAMRDDGPIYALEMGEQIRIQDLARNLIRLSGFVPDQEIAVQFIGLRPGEKLYEELVEEGESAQPAGVAKIMRVQPTAPIGADFNERLRELEAAAGAGRDADVMRLLSELVPTFRPPSAQPSGRVVTV
jgi:FlaA1/EpsC-like NDP-sugar epimerase